MILRCQWEGMYNSRTTNCIMIINYNSSAKFWESSEVEPPVPEHQLLQSFLKRSDPPAGTTYLQFTLMYVIKQLWMQKHVPLCMLMSVCTHKKTVYSALALKLQHHTHANFRFANQSTELQLSLTFTYFHNTFIVIYVYREVGLVYCQVWLHIPT
jgi:hypothetical protein